MGGNRRENSACGLVRQGFGCHEAFLYNLFWGGGQRDIEKPLYRTGYTHLAFQPGGREAVNGLTARLRDAGYEVVSGPRVTGDGYYESCALDPEGNQIEIVAAEDMI